MPLQNVEYNDLINGIDKLTKNIQLLSGEDTERTQYTFTWAGSPPLNILEDDETEPAIDIQPAQLGLEAPSFKTEVEGLRSSP